MEIDQLCNSRYYFVVIGLVTLAELFNFAMLVNLKCNFNVINFYFKCILYV